VAEIKVERKRRSLLPLLLGLLLLLLIAWWLLNRTTGTTTAGASADTATVATGIVPPAPITNDTAAGTLAPGAAATGAAAGGALGDYVEFVGNNRVERNEDEQHAYTAGGLRRLATVLEGMNPTGAARAQVDLIRQKADSLQITSTGDDRHADMTRAAFTAAAEAMRTLPMAKGVSANLDGLTRAAAAVRPERHMLEQKDQIQAFFDAARAALQAMGGTGAA
jgi:hypothetical protein